MEWPSRFYALRRGEGCPMCEQGRPDETRYGVRFFAGEVTDAYLHRGGVQRGLSHVYWRGRHVVEPTELEPEESARFWHELLLAGRAIERVFAPVKMNYDILGNSVPHLHVHLVPRYADDPRPEWPFPFPEDDPEPLPEVELRADAARLCDVAQALAARSCPFEQASVWKPVRRPTESIGTFSNHVTVAVQVDGDDLPRSPVREPQTAVVPSRRLGHGEAVEQYARLHGPSFVVFTDTDATDGEDSSVVTHPGVGAPKHRSGPRLNPSSHLSRSPTTAL